MASVASDDCDVDEYSLKMYRASCLARGVDPPSDPDEFCAVVKRFAKNLAASKAAANAKPDPKAANGNGAFMNRGRGLSVELDPNDVVVVAEPPAETGPRNGESMEEYIMRRLRDQA